ncbi:MAG: type I-U CRISPR-associated protein Csx17 [Bacteroidota bacterium]|nr:type I-U CRISPR-associated protein Csx17 [Bacteroidota bacterium]
MNELRLNNCRPEPLLSYLKALGVFRLVAEDKENGDPTARLSWSGGTAVLHSRFERDGLLGFFLEQYAPTPILAPWNGDSGFYKGGSKAIDKSGPKAIDCIEASESPRFERFRQAIRIIRGFAPKKRPKGEEKHLLMLNCRNELPDDVVPWLDTCYVLAENAQHFFPLLGTGGNDRHLEFTNNYMKRLVEILPPAGGRVPDELKKYLSAALFQDPIFDIKKKRAKGQFDPIKKRAIGQFDPGGAGGANATQDGFEADSLVNPWDYVLMMEGALLLAGSATRRFRTGAVSQASFPFSVDPVAVGFGTSAAEEASRDRARIEIWLPLWDGPMTYGEAKRLFSEGRAQFGKRQASNAVEFALAVNLLGVDRGLSSFTRYGFLRRNGSSFIAAPLGRCAVTHRPEARLLEDPALNGWLDRLRRASSQKKTPERFRRALRGVDAALFSFTTRSEVGNDSVYFAEILAALGDAERCIALAPVRAKELGIRPLQNLRGEWAEKADDGSAEFRLARSLASVGGEGAERGSPATIGKGFSVSPMRYFIEPVTASGYVEWAEGSVSAVWSNLPVHENLAAVFRRREMESFRAGLHGISLPARYNAHLADVISFLRAETDDEKLGRLLWGLCTVNWEACDRERKMRHSSDLPDQQREKAKAAVPFEYGILRLLVQPAVVEAERDHWRYRRLTRDEQPNIVPDPSVFALLGSNRKEAVSTALDRAARRLKAGGLLVHGYRYSGRSGRPMEIRSSFEPSRLLASLLFPLSYHDMNFIVNSVLYPPEEKE